MLWVVASLLTLVEDVFSEEDSKETQADLQHVLRQPSWPPAEDLEKDGGVQTPWPEALGKYRYKSVVSDMKGNEGVLLHVH